MDDDIRAAAVYSALWVVLLVVFAILATGGKAALALVTLGLGGAALLIWLHFDTLREKDRERIQRYSDAADNRIKEECENERN